MDYSLHHQQSGGGAHSSSSSSRSSINSSMVSMGWNNEPPPPTNAPVSAMKLPSDDDLRKEGIENILKRLRIAEHEQRRLTRIINDRNQVIHRFQHQALQLRSMTELNQRLTMEKNKLMSDKEELTGLVCFVDDDRHKAKRCCREWQKYGRYAHSALQKELTSFNSKIKDLEHKQSLLMQDNKNLKEIIVMLDQEHTGSRDSVNSQNSIPSGTTGLLSVSGTRDSGDGSSNGSTTGSSSPDHRSTTHRVNAKEALYSSDPSQGNSYVRYLEHKVRHLEEESKGRMKNIQTASDDPSPPLHRSSPPPPTTISSSNDLLHHTPLTSPGNIQHQHQRRYFSASSVPVAVAATPAAAPSMVAKSINCCTAVAATTLVNNSTASSCSSTDPLACRLSRAVTSQHPVLLQCAEHSPVPVDLANLTTGTCVSPPMMMTTSSAAVPSPPVVPGVVGSSKAVGVILDEKERASVRDMCNVSQTVWKKLADNKQRMLLNGGVAVSKTPVQKTQSVSEI